MFMSLSEDLYKSNDMTDLDCKLKLDPSTISAIIVSIFLYDFKVYDNILEEYTFSQLDTNDGIPLGTPDQIDFLISLCQTIVDNGGTYEILVTWNKK